MKQLIIGTAGHIDHGKTSLIKALTGFDGDENPHEKSRGITIDLSFSNLHTATTNIAFIDVPGHEKLVKNMIAGAFGFDYLLLAVAADDGVMPQTVEHLSIARILGVTSVVVAITKCDLVSSDRSDEVAGEIADLIMQNGLDLITTLKVSIHDSSSIENLKNTLLNLDAKPHRSDRFFRLFVDRSFTIKGAGAVITGTVIDGAVSEKERIFVANSQKDAVVRSVQVHSQTVKSATAGNRVALNLTEVDPKYLERGVLLTKKGFLRGFYRVSAHITMLKEFAHNSTLQLHYGTDTMQTTVNFLGDGFVDLVLERDVYAMFGDRFVLRDEADSVGGGVILAPIADPMNKEQKKRFLRALYDEDIAGAFELMVQAHKRGFGLVSATQRFGLTHDEALAVASELKDVFVDSKALVVYHNSSIDLLKKGVSSLFEKNPRALLSANSLSIRFKWASESFVEYTLKELLANGELIYEDGLYKSPSNDVKDVAGYIKETIYKRLEESKLAPDAPYNIYDELDLDRVEGDNALKALTKEGKVIRLAHNLFITAANLQLAMQRLREIIATDGYADVQNAKDHLGLSRKYTICYLEHLDKFSDIKKVENRRVLK